MRSRKEREDEKEWVTSASKLFCIAVSLLFLYLLVKYAFSALVPFAVAYLFSLLIVPSASYTSKKTGISSRLWAVVYVTVVLLSLAALLYFGVRRLVSELSELVESASRGEGELATLLSALTDAIEGMSSSDGWLSRLVGSENFGALTEKLGGLISGLGEQIISFAASYLGTLVGNTVTATPSFLLGVAVTVIACYYFCADSAKISSGIKGLIPAAYRDRVIRGVSVAKRAMKRYAKAYLILMAMTFSEVFIGLSILKVKYSFLIALGVAFVDILPVLGAGALLIPWAAVSFLLHDTRLGIGLLILYGVITIVRQISEPHVIGSSIGLHPAASLFSTYAGLKLFGIWGMILGPAAAFIIREIINGRRAQYENKSDISVEDGS